MNADIVMVVIISLATITIVALFAWINTRANQRLIDARFGELEKSIRSGLEIVRDQQATRTLDTIRRAVDAIGEHATESSEAVFEKSQTALKERDLALVEGLKLLATSVGEAKAASQEALELLHDSKPTLMPMGAPSGERSYTRDEVRRITYAALRKDRENRERAFVEQLAPPRQDHPKQGGLELEADGGDDLYGDRRDDKPREETDWEHQRRRIEELDPIVKHYANLAEVEIDKLPSEEFEKARAALKELKALTHTRLAKKAQAAITEPKRTSFDDILDIARTQETDPS